MNTKTLINSYGSYLNSKTWDYFTTISFKWPIKENRNRIIMDRLANELQKTEKEFEMFWVSEWHKSGTSVHNHLLFRGDIKYDINKYCTSNNIANKKNIYHLKYDTNKGAAYYICKNIDKSVDNDIYYSKQINGKRFNIF